MPEYRRIFIEDGVFILAARRGGEVANHQSQILERYPPLRRFGTFARVYLGMFDFDFKCPDRQGR